RLRSLKNALESLHPRKKLRRNADGFTKTPLKLAQAQSGCARDCGNTHLACGAFKMTNRCNNRYCIVAARNRWIAEDSIEPGDRGERRAQIAEALQFLPESPRQTFSRLNGIRQFPHWKPEDSARSVRMKANAEHPRSAARANQQRAGNLP